jgi:hypothetical protein
VILVLWSVGQGKTADPQAEARGRQVEGDYCSQDAVKSVPWLIRVGCLAIVSADSSFMN